MITSATPSSELWELLKAEAKNIGKKEPMLKLLMQQAILNCRSFEHSLGKIISAHLQSELIGRSELFQVCMQAYSNCPELLEYAASDIVAVRTRDPASVSLVGILLYLKGPHVLESWRVSNWLYRQGRRDLAGFFQSRISEVFGVDIHPAATIGKGIMLDHATGIVIGETAVVADTVSLLHGVTLGGTGKDQGDRHPKVGRGVMIGAGAKILGNISIGEGAIVGAGSVVLRNVPPHTTVVGVPARVVGHPKQAMPSLEMDQTLSEKLPSDFNDICPAIKSKRI